MMLHVIMDATRRRHTKRDKPKKWDEPQVEDPVVLELHDSPGQQTVLWSGAGARQQVQRSLALDFILTKSSEHDRLSS
jgi:hypothetical protein